MTLSFSRYLNIRSAHSPVLSPDGRRLAFLSDITGSVQAWSVRVDEPTALDGSASQPDKLAWPHQLTFFEDKVWELHGAGVVDKLIAVSDVGGNERQQLYLIEFEGRAPDEVHTVRRLTTNDDAIHRFGAWSRDGRRVLYTSNARNNVDFDLYQVEVETGKSQLLHESQGNRSVAAWSPDGRSVLMADSRAAEQTELYRIDLETSSGGGTEHHITADHRSARYGSIHWTDVGIFLLTDRTCNTGAECVLDPETGALDEIVRADDLVQRLAAEDDNVAADARGELDALIATPDGRRVALTLNVEGYSHLIWLDPATGVMLAELPRGVIGHGSSGSGGLAFGGGGDYLLFELETPTQPVDIWMVNAAGGFMRQLTFSDRAGIDPASFVEPALVRFPTFDGRELPAHLYLPLAASAQAAAGKTGGRFPCILYVHGGPASQQRPTFDVRFQYFLQQGYALLVPNVRGSTGYGRDYMMLDDVEKRGDSVADLQAAVQWLHTRPEIDPDRIAIYGRSYGGFMVLAAMTEYPELFAAGIDVVGIADWVTFLERTSPWRRAHREREYGSLTEHRDVLERLSPIHKIERIAAPLMVVAGDNDPRVPLYESEQVVDKLQAAGGTVEFLHYADEGHKISKLKNRVDSFTKMAAFLEKYV